MFTLDADEIKRLNEWEKALPHSENLGAIGGRFTFMFTPTSLGTIARVKDGVSGQEIDLTDYSMW